MNIVDSCGWLEYFADGVNASFFVPIIEDLPNLIVPSICIYEVFKSILIQRDETSALLAISGMKKAKVVALDDEISIYAAKISATHKTPMADSIIYATSKIYNAVVYTQDKDFSKFQDVKYIEKK